MGLCKIISLALFCLTGLAMVHPSYAQDSPQDYLDAHNAARAEVGVGPMTWNDTVAAYAQNYANKHIGDCELVHSGGPYGENLAMSTGNLTGTAAVKMWVDEKANYDNNSNSCASGALCGHYTQVVWRKSSRLGCAKVRCNSGGTFIICNYDPPGNYIGQRPYSADPPANSADPPAADPPANNADPPANSADPPANNADPPAASQDSPQDYLDAHNAARAQVGVGPMTWDNTVAAYAQNYANQHIGDCNSVHSSGPYGENLAMSIGDLSGTDAVKMWVDEKANYDYYSNSCATGAVCGHYTQVVWQNSIRLGCAKVRCNSGGTFIGCNYDPPGNYVGMRPYSADPSANNADPPANDNADPPGQVGSNDKKQAGKKRERIIISLALVAGVLFMGLGLTLYVWKKSSRQGKKGHNAKKGYSTEDLELPLFDLATLTNATNNFSINNKLGEGGFGPVYKGVLEDGKEIAVKRLSKNSRQGLHEFKNEVVHIAKLQHRNLVKLLGCCIEVDETILIYEFMPNKSLDFFIFDQTQNMLLNWPKRFHIINGIAQGLLYLHRDSRLRIIHRDLKAGNILLDSEMNPKISDFGLARSFSGNETGANTNKVVGTYGYMSPEYAIDGLYSIKSDVFSFGVLLLEVVSGKRNRGFHHPEYHLNLIGHAWKLHTEGKSLELIDAAIGDPHNLSEVLRSIHVGLLCVQPCPEDRPSMSLVVLMLGSESALPQPKQPSFYTERTVVRANSSPSKCELCSANGLTISLLEAR